MTEATGKQWKPGPWLQVVITEWQSHNSAFEYCPAFFFHKFRNRSYNSSSFISRNPFSIVKHFALSESFPWNKNNTFTFNPSLFFAQFSFWKKYWFKKAWRRVNTLHFFFSWSIPRRMRWRGGCQSLRHRFGKNILLYMRTWSVGVRRIQLREEGGLTCMTQASRSHCRDTTQF